MPKKILTLNNLSPNYFEFDEDKQQIIYKISKEPGNLVKFDEQGKLTLDRSSLKQAEIIWEGHVTEPLTEIYVNDYELFNSVAHNDYVLKSVVIANETNGLEYSFTTFHVGNVINTESFFFIERDKFKMKDIRDFRNVENVQKLNPLLFKYQDSGYSIKILNIPKNYYVKKIILL